MHLTNEFLQENVPNHVPINYLFIYLISTLRYQKFGECLQKQKVALLVEITLEK
jgi:hypothetical protein